jgi:hypothetical protein
MKHFLLQLTFLIVIAGCKDKEEVEPKLFPYFYCKVNGQNFAGVPSGPLTGCEPWRFNYFQNEFNGIPANTVGVNGLNCKTFEKVGIALWGFDPSVHMYDLCDTNLDSCGVVYGSSPDLGDQVLFESDVHGFIQFNRFSDRNSSKNGVVSGTFEFSATNFELDSTIYITEGRFQYIIDYEWY